MTLAKRCYLTTSGFPRSETFGLSAQIRCSASSVPANNAEGYGRESTQGFIQFLRIAQGSLKELETHLLLAERIRLIAGRASAELLASGDQIGRMLRSDDPIASKPSQHEGGGKMRSHYSLLTTHLSHVRHLQGALAHP